MKNLFAKLKAWQTFIVLIGPMIFGAIYSEPGPGSLNLVINILLAVLYFFWIWGISSFLSSLTNKSNIFLTIFISLDAVIFISNSFYYLFKPDIEYNPPLVVSLIALAILIYCLVSVSRMLSLSEQERNLSNSHFLLYVVLLLAFPIGIWIIQPKLNRLYKITLNNLP